jgi:hypothetical protein
VHPSDEIFYTYPNGNDILISPERQRLQSKAGHVDARPHIRQLAELLLQRTADHASVNRRANVADGFAGCPLSSNSVPISAGN